MKEEQQGPWLIVCSGFHAAGYTDALLADMAQYPIWQTLHVWRSLTVLSGSELRCSLELDLGLPQGNRPSPPLIFLAFSAGCVAAVSVARYWQVQGGRVLALLAVDGWGVPLVAPFPVHRLSHDAFTHTTSAFLGTGQQNFYADPSVSHLQLWQQPSQVWGWQTKMGQPATAPDQRTTAGDCLANWLAGYCAL